MAGNLQFVSWSRRGVGASTAIGQLGSRRLVTTRVSVTANRKGQDAPTVVPFDSAPMAVLGPADVEGVAIEQIVRRSPLPDNHNLEPNYLAAIEFAHPDLPWLFSPSTAAGPDHLDPWLMLAVVDRTQMQVTPRPGSPNPVLVLSDPDALPDPRDAWAWAHVQVHDTDAPGAKAAVEGDQPVAANIRSRVLCPTRLAPEHDYLAVLLPTFEAGRRVGIGLDESDAGVAFWQAAGGLVLPVYDSWRFRTGPSGDFETLARKLHAVTGEALQHLGERLVTIEPRAALMQRADASPDLFAPVVHRIPTAIAKASTSVKEVPGPLAPDSPAPDPQADLFHRRLKELVDIVAAASDEAPIVGPPLYGRWPAVVTSLDGHPEDPALAAVPAGQAQTWVEQLNADPDLRVAAGVATQVVQHDQEPLMTDAWSQLSVVLAANARMRWGRLFASASSVMHGRLEAASAASALRTTASSFGRVLARQGQTVRAEVDASTLPREALGSAFVRVARYAVRAEARAAVGTSVVSTTSNAVEAIRTSAAAVLPRRFTTTRALDPGVLGQVLDTSELSAQVSAGLGTDPDSYLKRIGAVPHDLQRIASRFEDVKPPRRQPREVAGRGEPRVRITDGKAQQIRRMSSVVERPEVAGRLRMGDVVSHDIGALHEAEEPTVSLQTVEAMNRLAASGVAHAHDARVDLTTAKVRIGVSNHLSQTVEVLTKAVGATSAQAQVFNAGDQLRTAALANLGVPSPPALEVLVGEVGPAQSAALRRSLEGVVGAVTPIGATLTPPPLATFDLGTKQTVVAALEPEAAYSRMLAYAHQGISDLVVRRPGSQFHPAMASPQFTAPLVDRLKVLDEDWVLGGVEKMPANSICLMSVNWRFVESFLAGANHEMARELLWRGYPTDLRGSCFRQFWNSPTPDISSMDSWSGDIGGHSAGGQRDELTMVVIKGDLLRRYPATLVSAERGTASANADEEQFTSDDVFGKELFRGFLGADVTYVALDISIDTLRTPVDPGNPRHSWYISLLEPHDEPRFGLDDPDGVQSPNKPPPVEGDYDVTDQWTWQGVAPTGLRHLKPDSVFADDSSAVAGASLFQRPFRLLMRAPDYLPPE